MPRHRHTPRTSPSQVSCSYEKDRPETQPARSAQQSLATSVAIAHCRRIPTAAHLQSHKHRASRAEEVRGDGCRHEALLGFLVADRQVHSARSEPERHCSSKSGRAKHNLRSVSAWRQPGKCAVGDARESGQA
eukprot:3899005-Rhodomonas_salina.2